MHFFTPEQKEFIKDNVNGISNLELTEKFNDYFGLSLVVSQIKAFKKKSWF